MTQWRRWNAATTSSCTICPNQPARRSSVPYRVLPLLRYVPDVGRYGAAEAGQLLEFRISREWIAHVRSDRYLTASQFREIYGRLLPGAQFTRLTHYMGVVWTVPG